jgi:hypothetical protein
MHLNEFLFLNLPPTQHSLHPYAICDREASKHIHQTFNLHKFGRLYVSVLRLVQGGNMSPH